MNTALLSVFGSCIATIIPLLIVCLIIKEKNSRYILIYFCWGTLAGLLAFIINSLLSQSPGQEDRLLTVIAPIVEESLKGLPLLLFLNRKRYPKITELIVYCAIATGVGFSIQESMYYFNHVTGSVGLIVTLTARTLTTALMHGVSTAIIGFGLMLMQNQRHIILPLIFGLFAVSVSIHATFNLLLPTNFAMIAILIPVSLYLTGIVLLKKT